MSEYENLPSSVGRFSTKFWLRDYEQFVRDNEDKVVDDLATFEEEISGKMSDDRSVDFYTDRNITHSISRNKNEIRAFLEWPEFEHWKGFVRLENMTGFGMR